jgi:uncharacterized protein (TIGR00299 family) protein
VDGVVEGPVGESVTGEGGVQSHHGSSTDPGEIRTILDKAALDPVVRELAGEVFDRLAGAEARVHGAADGHVHLHEVGALDAIIDVVCSIAGLRELAPGRVIATPPREGHGEIRAAHGILPIPAPATLALLEGVELERIDVPFELVTPTGAALLITLADEISRTFSIRPERIGYGAGTRELTDRPNLLRGTLGEGDPSSLPGQDEVVVLETAVDDTVPETWPWLIERLLEAGARDAWMTPVLMKKGRPGIELTVVAVPGSEDELARLIFTEIPTLGIRFRRTQRMIRQRAPGTVETRFGPMRVKLSRMSEAEAWEIHPEFEACRAAAVEHGLPLREVYREVALADAGDVTIDEAEGEKP